MDAGGRAPTVGALGDAGAIAEAQLPLLLTLSTYIIYRDVVTAIAPGNLAAFPPSLEVNADIAGANICPCRQRRSSCRELEGTDTRL
jgi:hypothetical protein